jgi:molecular chaperone DnaK
MASDTYGLYERHLLKLIEQFLQGVAGAPTRVIEEEKLYHQEVVDRGLKSLPMPLRMVSRERLGWDRFFQALHKEAFLNKDGRVALRPNLDRRLAALARELFKSPAKASSPGGQAERAKEVGPAVEEPVQEPAAVSEEAEPQADVALGIDLGTTYSVVAHLDGHGRPVSIPNAAGDVLTPSVVLFEGEGTVVGKEAVLASPLEPERVADCVKRDMGSKSYRKVINGESLPPEVISSFILRSLKGDAERKLGPVGKAVITVPAYFDEGRRRATMDAGRLAGLEVLDIINEPTAAAIAYGHQLGYLDESGKAAGGRPLQVLVFDLGGGTFDVTIVRIEGASFRALATDGDVRLGGKDWDEKLIDLAAAAFRAKYREDPRENPVSLQELWLAAEAAKRTLSERTRAGLYVHHLGTRLKLEVSREQFEEATAPLLERTRATTEIVVRQAGLSWDALDRVLLVGGATRMPMVVRMLEELSGKKPDRSVSADEAVAHGAALYADLLLKKQGQKAGTPAAPPRFAVTNVNSHSLGVLGVDTRTGLKRNKVLIPKNTPLPHTVTRVFKTHRPHQANVVIQVVEGESERPEGCIKVGTCKIENLPPDLPADWPVQVSYSYESNGRLHVTGKVKGHDARVVADFQRDNSMSEKDMEMWAYCILESIPDE